MRKDHNSMLGLHRSQGSSKSKAGTLQNHDDDSAKGKKRREATILRWMGRKRVFFYSVLYTKKKAPPRQHLNLRGKRKKKNTHKLKNEHAARNTRLKLPDSVLLVLLAHSSSSPLLLQLLRSLVISMTAIHSCPLSRAASLPNATPDSLEVLMFDDLLLRRSFEDARGRGGARPADADLLPSFSFPIVPLVASRGPGRAGPPSVLVRLGSRPFATRSGPRAGRESVSCRRSSASSVCSKIVFGLSFAFGSAELPGVFLDELPPSSIASSWHDGGGGLGFGGCGFFFVSDAVELCLSPMILRH